MANDKRVIARFFSPNSEARTQAIVDRVMSLLDSEAAEQLQLVYNDFKGRHKDLDAVLDEHFHHVKRYVQDRANCSLVHQRLIGAYFTMEYSIAAAALFNPSIVLHPNQEDLPEGACRFIMSLRATGEGHVSSIVFRTGIIDDQAQVHFDSPSPYASPARVVTDRYYDKHTFALKLGEIGDANPNARAILAGLPEQFSISQLDDAIEQSRPDQPPASGFEQTAETMLWLARSNYHLELPPQVDPSEVVIFPSSENEAKGIEDVRLVRFVEDDGSVRYYGTYTAYNGSRALPQLIETDDFSLIEIHTLNGRYVQNKGMALFPRKIQGQYWMISRLDGENLYIMRADNHRFWNEAELLMTPQQPWEFVQIGNCGSPIETEAGWLLLTHGVGPMRRYCIGAMLLDLEEPWKVIGQLKQPLLVPIETERDGYVPNVVYSCGSLIHAGQLIMPYAMSDVASSFATVPVDELLSHLQE